MSNVKNETDGAILLEDTSDLESVPQAELHTSEAVFVMPDKEKSDGLTIFKIHVPPFWLGFIGAAILALLIALVSR